MDSCVYCGRREYLQLKFIEQSGQKFTVAVCKWCRGVETKNAKRKFLEQIKLKQASLIGPEIKNAHHIGE